MADEPARMTIKPTETGTFPLAIAVRGARRAPWANRGDKKSDKRPRDWLEIIATSRRRPLGREYNLRVRHVQPGSAPAHAQHIGQGHAEPDCHPSFQ